MNKIAHWFLVITLGILLSGCSTTGEKTVDFTFVINATDNINPDINGRPSSVVVRVFQLSNRINFENATYEELFNPGGNTLGTEFIDVDEYLIDPGTRTELEQQISENTRYIGVIVGYRSVDMVTWRTLLATPEGGYFSQAGVEIRIDKLSVRVIEI